MRRAVGEVFARPEYHWVPRRHPLQWLGHWLHTLLAWLTRMDETHHTVFQLLLWVAIVVLLGILVHFGYLAWRIYRSTVQPGRPAPVAPGLQLEDAGAHLRRAEELARSGRFAEALAHRFTAVILQLDRAQALQFHPSKTPAEYAREAALDAAGRATLTGLVARLYHHVFGAAPCDATGYHDFGADAQLVLQHVLPH